MIRGWCDLIHPATEIKRIKLINYHIHEQLEPTCGLCLIWSPDCHSVHPCFQPPFYALLVEINTKLKTAVLSKACHNLHIHKLNQATVRTIKTLEIPSRLLQFPSENHNIALRDVEQNMQTQTLPSPWRDLQAFMKIEYRQGQPSEIGYSYNLLPFDKHNRF